jgi:hypothetical protein
MSDLGRPAEYRVFALVDSNTGQLAYIGADRRGKPRWPAIWEHRDVLSGELASFLRSQSERPAEVVLLGSAIGLPAKVARAAADLLRGLVPGSIQERKAAGRRRPVAQVGKDGSLRSWPSQSACGRALGLTKWGVITRIKIGTLLDLGQP